MVPPEIVLINWSILALEVNAMPADAGAPKAARASAGTVLGAYDRQHVLLFQSPFHLLWSNQIQDMVQNVNMSFIIFKTIWHVKS